MFKKISLVISVLSLIVSLTQLVYAQTQDKKIPDDFDKRWNRAAELMEKGEYKEAISTYMIMISSLDKGETRGACWYNIACAYMRLKEEKSALQSLGYAIKDGYRKIENYEADEDLKPLKEHKLFIHYLELLKENKPETLDNIDVEKLIDKYCKTIDNDKTEKLKKLFEALSKHVDEELGKIKEKVYEDVEKLIDELLDKKTKAAVYKAYLGILVEDLTEDTKQFFKLPNHQGVLINSVTPGSPAEKAGLFPLDIILKCDGKDVANSEMMKKFVKNAKPGGTMNFLVLRSRKQIKIVVNLGKKLVEGTAEEKLNALEYGLIGVRLDQQKDGLIVLDTESKSPAERAGLKSDDLIISVDGQKIASLMQFRDFLKQKFVGDEITIKVLRDGKELDVKLTIGQRKPVIKDKANPRVRIVTNVGSFVVELYEDSAPNTVANFIELCQNNFYDDIRFHRIIKNFMVQIGCPFARGELSPRAGTGDAGYKFADEFDENLKFDQPGLLAMANSGPNTNGSQIFITTAKECPWLNGHHAIFGKIVEGMDVIYKIAETPVEKDPANPQAAKPTKDVYIIATEILVLRNHEYKVKKLEE